VRINGHIALLAISIALLSFASLAFSEDSPCFVAYWDASKNNELMECETSAKGGDAHSEFDYGLILFSGHDRTNDRASGLEWFRKSARQGFPLARGALCSLLTRDLGKGLTNSVEAYAWCRIGGSAKRASEIKSGLTDLDAADAERLASEYLANYGPNRPLVMGPNNLLERSRDASSVMGGAIR
jgi:TPR repeat protein